MGKVILMKKLLFLFTCLAFISAKRPCTVSSKQPITQVTITPSDKHQVIKGWGVSLCWWANLAGGMSQPIIDSLTEMAAVDLNFNVFRFNIGGGKNPNCTNGAHMRPDGGEMPGYRSKCNDQAGWGTYSLENDKRQIAVMEKLSTYRNDIITEVFSNSPPWWMTKSQCAAGGEGGAENLDPDFSDDFADYLATVATALNQAHPAWHIRYIEPFNEPLSNWWTKGNNQEGCAFSTATQADVLWRLWQQQSAYGLSSIGLSAADCNAVEESISAMISLQANHPGEYNGLAKINTHSYMGTWSEKRDLQIFCKNNGNKEVWQTETGPLNWSPPDGKSWWQRHYMIAYRMVEDLRNLQCPVWCDWQLMSTDEGWGLLHQTNFDQAHPYQDASFVKTRGYYCRKNVTRFIKPGYQMIGSSDGNSMAALNPDSTEVVFVLVNQDGNSKPYTVDLTQFQAISGFATYRTSGDDGSSENCTEILASDATGKGTISGNVISYIAPPHSVTTFVIQTTGCITKSATAMKNRKPPIRLCRRKGGI